MQLIELRCFYTLFGLVFSTVEFDMITFASRDSSRIFFSYILLHKLLVCLYDQAGLGQGPQALLGGEGPAYQANTGLQGNVGGAQG